ncbi:MAG: electron transfer flavoprotein subunit alpha/FixB family protein [Gemmatimonadales bacterium]
MSDVLAFLEPREGRLGGNAFEVMSVAARLAAGSGGAAHALVLGEPGVSSAASDLGRYGAASVTVSEHDALAHYHPEAYAAVFAEHVKGGAYGAVVLAATVLGRDLAPRVAALLDVPLATDATGVELADGAVSVVRPVYSGKAFATLEMSAAPALVTLRPNAFPVTESRAAGEVTTVTPQLDPSRWRVRVIERKRAAEGAVDVAEASVIVSGGRGMKDPSHWNLLEALRDALGPGVALGASRAVVDAGWRPHGEQVGQTGKTVAPKLYIAVGISGAVQHLAGMRTAKTIVAINRDADAPIFAVADYGIVGDLFEVLPRLSEEIAALKAGS